MPAGAAIGPRPAAGALTPLRSFLVAAALVLVTGAAVSSCATIRGLRALRAVDFELAGVASARLAGVELTRLQRVSDVPPLGLARMTSGLARRDLPLELTLRLAASNPGDNPEARLVRMTWTLLLDGREAVHGELAEPVIIPPGEVTVIPLEARLNLVEFVQGQIPELVETALAVAGVGTGSTEVALRVVPTIDTRLGAIRYPRPITVLRRQVGR